MTASNRLRRAAAALVAVAALGLLACGPDDDASREPAPEAVALANQEDEVCGMLVREQPAPRSQMTHHDGTRFFFCSIGDLLVHLGAPSPHGRADAVFVEVMSAEQNPAEPRTDEHPWLPAGDAIYVVGIDRPGIMGAPVLAYATRSDAERVVGTHAGAQALDLPGLQKWWEAREATR